MAAVETFTFDEALSAIGNAEIIYSATGPEGPTWENFGPIEDARSFEVDYVEIPLTAPEHTGTLPHQVEMNAVGARITGTAIVYQDVLDRLSPHGIGGGGYSYPRAPLEYAVGLIPREEIGDALSNSDGTTAGWSRTPLGGGTALTGADGAPVHAIWLPRCYVKHDAIPLGGGDDRRRMVTFTFTALFYAAGGEGYKVYTIGDPNRVGPAYGVEIV